MRITQSTSVRGLNPDWPSPAISHASRALGESGLATQDYHREACEMAGTAWSVEETRALLNLWCDDRVQRQLEGAVRNKAIFEEIQRNLGSLGYHRTWLQCRVKVKNLIATYRKIKDNNSRSGQGRSDFIFFDLLDRILGTRPASRPTNLLSSSPPTHPPAQESPPTHPPAQESPPTHPPAQDSQSAHEEGERHQTAEEDEAEEEGEDQDSALHQQSEDADSNDGEDREGETTELDDSGPSPSPSTPARMTATTTAVNSTPSTSGTRRKRTEADRRIAEVLEQLERQTKESDRRFFEFEGKRMKAEAEREDRRASREEEHMMRMQQLFMQQMQQMMMFSSYGPPPFAYPPVSRSATLSQPSTSAPVPRQGEPSQRSDDSP